MSAKQALVTKMEGDEAAEQKREENWLKRDEKLEQKAIRLQADRQEAIDALGGLQKAHFEKRQEMAHEENLKRELLWKAHKKKDEQRKTDQKASLDMVAYAKDKEKGEKAEKVKKEKKQESSKMDAVESKMREKMEKETKKTEDLKNEELKRLETWKKLDRERKNMLEK